MLIRFRVSNFRSLKEEQELSLVASSLKDSPESVTHVAGLNLGLLPVAAIYGANASGKTNVIKALSYMAGVVRVSQRHWSPEGPVPREPFLLDPQSRSEASSFEIDLLLDATRFHYGFKLNDREILEEWLDAYPTGRKPIKKQMWFKRQRKTFAFGKKLTGDNRAIEGLTRRNSLFLSAAAQNNHQALLPIYRWFADSLSYLGRDRAQTELQTVEMCQDENRKSSILRILRAADLGVVGLDVRWEDLFAVPASLGDEAKRAFEEFEIALKKFVTTAAQRRGEEPEFPDKKPALALIHKGLADASVPLLQENESDGTRAFFGLLGPVLQALTSGGTLCVDELDASLHPLLALEVVRLFNPKVNLRGAQVIFTTHDTNILDRASLRRDQIWFTEKDAEGGTHLYPLTDFKPRKNENLERGYLQGRYGAIPFVGSTDFLAEPQRGGG